jgi:hypothetical protein
VFGYQPQRTNRGRYKMFQNISMSTFAADLSLLGKKEAKYESAGAYLLQVIK